MVIWALFDDGNGSWNKLGKDNIISIGINDNDWKNYHRIDLSITNPNLIKELSKLPKPNVIIASPPCESWSIADNSRRAFRNIDNGVMTLHTQNDYIELNKGKLKRCFFRQQSKRLIGESTILATLKIIDFFAPKIWIIENPKTSSMWKYIKGISELKGIENDTYYNNYDNINFTKKPTKFLSNINLNLRNDNKVLAQKKWDHFNQGGGYDLSSSIPKELIQEIYLKIKSGGEYE